MTAELNINGKIVRTNHCEVCLYGIRHNDQHLHSERCSFYEDLRHEVEELKAKLKYTQESEVFWQNLSRILGGEHLS